MAGQTSNRDCLVSVFSKRQALFAASWHKEVSNGFIVDFKVRQRDFNDLLFLQFLYLLEKLLHRQEDYARLLCRACDCMRLSTTSRTVRKDCSIVTVQYTVEQVPRSRFVDIGLGSVLIEDSIESKSLVFHPLPLRYNRPRETLNRIIFWRVENTKILLDTQCIIESGRMHLQALVVNNFDHRADALLHELGSR